MINIIMSIGIYYILNTISKRTYIGSSKHIEKRLKDHIQSLNKGTHHNIFLQRAWNKYENAETVFISGILEPTTMNNLLYEEQLYLNVNESGYNIAPANGGDCISHHPNNKEIRNKIKMSLDKRYSLLSEEQRKQIYGRKGNKNGNWRDGGVSFNLCPICNLNTIRRTSKSCSDCRDRRRENNPFYNKHHSEQTKKILREKLSGDNSWIKGIDPKKLSYTKTYLITYADGETKKVSGLKIIAKEFNTSIANVYATIKRCEKNKIPKRGKFANISILEI